MGLLPSDFLQTPWFAVLSAFVAVNTIMYVTLAVTKLLPRLHPGTWFRKGTRRSETRNIDPDVP